MAALNSYYCDIDIDPDAVNWLAASIVAAPGAAATFVHRCIHYFDSPCSDIVNDLRCSLFDCSSCNCIRLNQLNSLALTCTAVAFHQHCHFDSDSFDYCTLDVNLAEENEEEKELVLFLFIVLNQFPDKEESFLLVIVHDRRMLWRTTSDVDRYSFECDSELRCASLEKSFIHSPLAAFNSLNNKLNKLNKHLSIFFFF